MLPNAASQRSRILNYSRRKIRAFGVSIRILRRVATKLRVVDVCCSLCGSSEVDPTGMAKVNETKKTVQGYIETIKDETATQAKCDYAKRQCTEAVTLFTKTKFDPEQTDHKYKMDQCKKISLLCMESIDNLKKDCRYLSWKPGHDSMMGYNTIMTEVESGMEPSEVLERAIRLKIIEEPAPSSDESSSDELDTDERVDMLFKKEGADHTKGYTFLVHGKHPAHSLECFDHGKDIAKILGLYTSEDNENFSKYQEACVKYNRKNKEVGLTNVLPLDLEGFLMNPNYQDYEVDPEHFEPKSIQGVVKKTWTYRA
eukprot:GHVU01058619.1.p1 GENE.GHVU01058619.1~~GHVU01058619.1.p1  ORF type:complete len:313 (-),score=33.32 GHVU01058619.1:47-985(-)